MFVAQNLKDCEEPHGGRWILNECNFEYDVLPVLPAAVVVPHGTKPDVCGPGTDGCDVSRYGYAYLS